jgi:hypothetical protein
MMMDDPLVKFFFYLCICKVKTKHIKLLALERSRIFNCWGHDHILHLERMEQSEANIFRSELCMSLCNLMSLIGLSQQILSLV